MVYNEVYSFSASSASSGSSRHAVYSASRSSPPDPHSSRSPRQAGGLPPSSSSAGYSHQQQRSGGGERGNGRVSSDHHHHYQGHLSSQRKRHTSRGNSDNSPHDRDRFRDRERDRDSVDDRDRDPSSSSRRHDSSSSCWDRLSRVGSWSEHVSSSGKRYYYNCSSEVSQWDKPAAWIDAERDRGRSERAPNSAAHTAATSSRRSRLNPGVSCGSQMSTHSGPAEPSGGTDGVSHKPVDERQRWTAVPDANRRADGKRQVEVSSGDSTPTEESAAAADADLSDPHHLPPVRLSMALSRLVQPTDVGNGTYDDASAPVWSSNSPCDPGCPIPSSTQTYSQQQPATIHAPTGSLSGSAVNSAGSVCAPAAVSAVCVPSCLTSASGPGTSQHPVASLTLTHGQYYREQLVCHVQNWAATQMEKQAARVSEEAHHMASELMTKAATNLKMARSLVRLAEIQATLQEQRILFLQQQIQELSEGRCQDNFLPSN